MTRHKASQKKDEEEMEEGKSQTKSGRKPNRERRDEATQKDQYLGTQPTLKTFGSG